MDAILFNLALIVIPFLVIKALQEAHYDGRK